MVKLNIQTVYYTFNKLTGTVFTIDKLLFNWKDLIQSEELKNKFSSKRLQTRYLIDKFYKKPTFLNPQITFDEEYKYKNIIMSICLPCYDEEWSEVSGTLRSLSKNILIHHKRPDKSFQLHVTVFIIQDGWNSSSKSLKEGITKEFGCISEKIIDKYLNNNSIIIVVPDTEIYYPSYNSILDEEQVGVTFHPVFITKIKNSQKFNSHLIFFSLCYLQKPDCVFLTDCGTLYDSDCLYKLVEYLNKKHATVIGVTARQKVMNAFKRREIKEYPHWWSTKKQNYCGTNLYKQLEWWLSPAALQGFEFESTFLLNISMFNLVGALPVLPGPCQLIWWEHLESGQYNSDGVLDIYFRHLNMNINNSGIIKTSTLLAEDRILSFSMILRTCELKTVWVKGATFSYEPMVTWIQLLSQRRRWVNGTIATYIYYLFDEKGSDEFSMSGVGNNKSLQILWGLQLYQSFLQILSPCFFTIALFESFLQTTQVHPNLLCFFTYKFLTPPIILSGIYFIFYISWIFVALILGKRSNYCPKILYNFFIELIYKFYALINSIVSIFIFYNIINTKNGLMTGQVFWILLFIWIIPFLLSISVTFSSTFLYIIYSLIYFINIIQYVSFIPTFAIARIHDISWGSRDSTSKITNKKSIEFLWTSLKLNFLIVLINLSILVFYEYIVISFGHLDYIYIIVFLILFMPLIIQYGCIIIYFILLLYKSICRGNAPK